MRPFRISFVIVLFGLGELFIIFVKVEYSYLCISHLHIFGESGANLCLQENNKN